ncbi:MAG TPA: FtsX-like permease family protein [Terriglobales bacterium]|nr:FtsX-like permease family protein [Terriglobales bacterium]
MSLQAHRPGSSPPISMFWRMLLRAAVRRRGRALSALLAMIVAAAAATAMLNLYVDVQAKLSKEFRNYGANVVLVAKDNQTFSSAALTTINSTLAGRGLAVPFAYVVARAADGQPIVVSGTDFDEVRKLDNWWSVMAWPNASQQALVGKRAAAVVSPQGKPFDLTFRGRSIHLVPAGTVQTGAAEDSRIYLSLADLEAWTGVQPSTVEIAVAGSPDEVNAMMSALARALPLADVHPVRQIVEGQARVLGKMRATLLATVLLIIVTSALCVLSTLMGWVLDRRRDFAIMKALGASARLIYGFFAAEAAALGCAGALIGFGLGAGAAAWIGRANFHAPVVPRFSVLPPIVAGSVAVALLAAIVPMALLRRVEPATILRGE